MTEQLRLDDSVAVITGAGGGLGRAHALLLASRGAGIVVNDLGGTTSGAGASATRAEEVVEEIIAAGGYAVASADPVGTADGARSIVAKAMAEFGRIDILINNAGIVRDAAFHKMSNEDIDAVLTVHLAGSIHLTREVWPLFREQQHGKIVNTTSNVGLLGNFGQANYASAKMGLVGLTRALAIEGARSNIHVNALAPAAITRMTPDGLVLDLELRPEDVSPAVAWLVHPDCRVSGEIISAGGGRFARFFVGVTRGYFAPEPSPEDVRDNFDRIVDESGYLVPDGPGAEVDLIRELAARFPAPPDQEPAS